MTLHGSETPHSHHGLQLRVETLKNVRMHRIRNLQLKPPKKCHHRLTLQMSLVFLHLLEQVVAGRLRGRSRPASEGGATELTSILTAVSPPLKHLIFGEGDRETFM